jgi:acyl dehydratase
MRLRYQDVEVGTRLPVSEFPVRRGDLVRYAGASGDFNPIHWNERAAKDAGLPDVIAHGMFTMGLVARVVTDWAGDPGGVTEYRVRFRRPVVVPEWDGTSVGVEGIVAEKLTDRRVLIELVVRCGPEKVLTAAKVVVRLTGNDDC